MSKHKGYWKSPIGWLRSIIGDAGLQSLEFIYKAREADDLPMSLEVHTQLHEYFEGKKIRFLIACDLQGTAFQKKVWAELQRIPYGRTVSYGQLAKAIGKPTAYRAVANACGANPIPIIVPCHRVVASNGGLGGYSSGIQKKEWLLKHEGVI